MKSSKPARSLTCLFAVVSIGITCGNAFAQLQQRPADQYIKAMNDPNRELKVPEVVEKLRLKPGDVVADIGSGSGSFTIAFAKAVAPNGVVYAVDIDPKMLDYVAAQAKKEGVTNVRTVLGDNDDPKLPVHNVDVAFFHRVLHMIEHRQVYVNATTKYLKSDGRFVIIDKNPEHSPNSWMWLKQSDVDTWMAANAFYPAESFDIFDDRYFVSYQRPYGDSVVLKKGWKPAQAKD